MVGTSESQLERVIPFTMVLLRRAMIHDLEFLIHADIESDGEYLAAMTPEEQRGHRLKIEGFVQEVACKAGWVCVDSDRGQPVGMILCRWRQCPREGDEEYSGESVFRELAEDLFPEDGRFCEIFQLWVDPGYRRRGLATRLKVHLEAECRERGVGMIYTHTEEQNLHVIALNERLGYLQVRRGPIWDEVVRVSLIKRLHDAVPESREKV